MRVLYYIIFQSNYNQCIRCDKLINKLNTQIKSAYKESKSLTHYTKDLPT